MLTRWLGGGGGWGGAVHVFRWPLQEVAPTWALGFDLSIFNMFYNKARKFT